MPFGRAVRFGTSSGKWKPLFRFDNATTKTPRSQSPAAEEAASIEAEARKRSETPEGRLLAIFDLFDEWFHREDFEGCSFINVMIETADVKHPIGRASVEHLENIRGVLRSLAEEAGLRDADDFARSFHILMKGSIVQAAEGDADAAKRAQQMARDLIEKYR